MICNDKHLSLSLRNTYIAMLARIVKKKSRAIKIPYKFTPQKFSNNKKMSIKKSLLNFDSENKQTNNKKRTYRRSIFI